jgi:alpha-beta hydrolase superfamily lysophospholipase
MECRSGATPLYRLAWAQVRFFKDEDFEFMTELALGAVYHRGADAGECLATTARIKNGDPESWFGEWSGVAERLAAQAAASERAGHPVSARRAYLRAATYYDTATFFVDRTREPERFLPTWKLHRSCWDRFCALSDPPIEPVGIPYEGTELSGYVFRSSRGREPRPLLILNNGSDGPVSAMWLQGAAGALPRGYDCLAFDGPGQGAALWLQGLHFRPDWEAVIGPVVDFALTLPGIDADRIALLGVSQGGYWVPRAVAFESRIAAAIADPGVWDVSTSWKQHLTKSMLKKLEAGDREKFNRDMALPMRFSRAIRGTVEFRARPFGRETLFDVYRALEEYKLEDVAERITCPILITDPEQEQFWPGQARQLYEAVGSKRKQLVRFTAAEGAESHCEPKALALRDERIFDWLDGVLGLV